MQCKEVLPLNKTEHEALRNVYRGEATEHQQKLAMAVIVKKFAHTHSLPYVEGSFDQTAFLSGRAYVGALILETINKPVSEDDET